MDRAQRFLICACLAAVITAGLWILMATNIVPSGGYDQSPPPAPLPEIEFIDRDR